MKLFLELFLSPSKVHSHFLIIFHLFQLILTHCKALNVLISTTSHLYLFHCKFPFDSLVQHKLRSLAPLEIPLSRGRQFFLFLSAAMSLSLLQ